MPAYLRGDAMIAIHEMQLAAHGGRPGVSDHKALATIVTAAQEWEDLAVAAAIYGAGVARLAPFEEGNTATAMALVETFLGLNGRALSAADLDVAGTFMALEDRRMDESTFAEWLRTRI